MDFYPGTDFEFANLPRETQVIWLAMEGNTDKTIAQLLEITTDTVATYWKRILIRYDSSSRTEVIAEFLREYFEDDLDQLERKVTELEEKLKAKGLAEQHQLLATAQLNSLMNLLDVGVLFTNNGLKVNYINEQLCRMAGCILKPKELIGSDISSFIEGCQNRAIKTDDSTTQRIRSLAISGQEKTVDQMTMTNGRVLERTFCNVTVRGSVIGHFIMYKDVTPFIHENKELIQKSKLNETLVQRTLAHFEASPKDQAKEVVTTLSCLAKNVGGDVAIIVETDTRRGTFNVLHAWAKNEFESEVAYEQSIPLSFVGWFRKQLSEKDYWILDSLENLPKSATMERSIFIEGRVRSAIAIKFRSSNPDKAYFVQLSTSRDNTLDHKVIESLVLIQRLLTSVFTQMERVEARSVE
jgi:DNA-binding CsgD family transcriptional regulator